MRCDVMQDDSHWIVGVTEEDVMCVLLKQVPA